MDLLSAAFRREYAGVVRLARRLTGDHALAEDVAQDVMVRLGDDAVLHTDPDRIRAWLWRTTTNASLNAIRGRGREDKRLRLVGPRHLAAVPGPEEVAVTNDEAAEVRRVLADLPERDRTMLVMRHSGCSYAEMAQATGLAASSVGTILARAQRAFATAYQEAAHAAV